MGLPAGRSASRSRGTAGRHPAVLPLLLLLLCPGAYGAAAPGEAEAPILYLWKTGKVDYHIYEGTESSYQRK
ncbi:hypothetical protein E5288_WYG001459 [Bos mutus]|uniref:Uncharacterized protein n=1 Tax=Bos mutus TaxID=72004 RepID=A0A6B0R676_9CETA|nr:hypothetical protein [Bos mutus]